MSTQKVLPFPAEKFHLSDDEACQSSSLDACLQVSKQPDICGDLVGRRTQRRKRCQYINIDLPRIRLRRYWVCIIEPRQLCHKFVEGLDLYRVNYQSGFNKNPIPLRDPHRKVTEN